MRRFALLAVAGFLLSGVFAAAAPADPKEEEKEGTILGTPIKRAQGGWLGLELKGANFQLTFYNDKKKPVPADKAPAVLRWSVHYQPNPERTELVATDNPAVLASTYTVKEPHTFKLHLSLLGDGAQDTDTYAKGAPEVESYVIDFSG